MSVKFEFSEKLYLGTGIDRRRLGKIKQTLNRDPILSKETLIIPAHNTVDLLDIVEARMFAQPHFNGSVLKVIGIASGNQEAIGLVEEMVKECLEVQNNCNLREYLGC